MPNDVLSAMSALDAQKAMANVPVATVDDLASADAIIFGTGAGQKNGSALFKSAYKTTRNRKGVKPSTA